MRGILLLLIVVRISLAITLRGSSLTRGPRLSGRMIRFSMIRRPRLLLLRITI
uniref:Uncharacterized protein n=1 Tax=Picea glauca TaxID=3330 RepID=A0A117NIB9_PICGL|nr:hypothetical protein ABT39_MTgene6233 [Picea glauca]KUM48752.1 hypothetical protein ABT39_MTgene4088 [Picea glauca]KUM49718.1 hypothetical protein ABT39_MTgene2945 [Picea glauca]QHR86090.1 hypothetical protein Q903MT_gene88 [Picea sitchensis]